MAALSEGIWVGVPNMEGKAGQHACAEIDFSLLAPGKLHRS
jgi:hypothetical protein